MPGHVEICQPQPSGHAHLDRVGGDLAEHLLSAHNATRKPIALQRRLIFPER